MSSNDYWYVMYESEYLKKISKSAVYNTLNHHKGVHTKSALRKIVESEDCLLVDDSKIHLDNVNYISESNPIGRFNGLIVSSAVFVNKESYKSD